MTLDEPTAAGRADWDEVDGPGDTAGGPVARAHRVISDALYGPLPVSRWAQALLDTEPFARLDGVSLSDAPGELLFKRPFPTRLTHSLGVYYLTRQARPRDRALQAAALAHDLGHGPFAHLTEPLMIERLGIDHERRGVELLRRALVELKGTSARLLAWLDLDEVGELLLGGGPEGRGALLNGLMDYATLDHVARFLRAADLGDPTYDPRTLARELRLAPPERDGERMPPVVALSPDAIREARAWQADRHRLCRYLAASERNLALHGMLRKAIDLAAEQGLLAPDFFDFTDAQALLLLRDGAGRGYSSGASALAQAALNNAFYQSVWTATAPEGSELIPDLFKQSRARLALEARIAQEAGLLPHEVILSLPEPCGERALPPLLAGERRRAEPIGSGSHGRPAPASEPARTLRLLIAPTSGRDYTRRARMAAERALGALGARSHTGGDLH